MDNRKTGSNVQIVPLDQFVVRMGNDFPGGYLKKELNNIRFCKVEQFQDALLGTFVIPDRKNPAREKKVFGFFLRNAELLFFDNGSFVAQGLRELEEYQIPEEPQGQELLFYFIEHLIEEDSLHLQEYDDRLSAMEEQLMEEETEDFDRNIFRIRKNFSSLGSYYHQLCDMCEKLQQYCGEQEDEKTAHQFELLSGRLGRLYSAVQMLTDYSIQLREMHQTKIATRQNRIMQTLTIAATIFMPLTLITGWYGMNFAGMPELESRAGYPVVCLVCGVIAAVEIILFKRKKWF